MNPALPIMELALSKYQLTGTTVSAEARRAVELGYEAILVRDHETILPPADTRRLIAAAQAEWPAIVLAVFQPATQESGYTQRISDFLIRLESGQNIPKGALNIRIYPVQLFVSRSFVSSCGSGFATEALVRGSWAGLPILSVPVQGADMTLQNRSAQTGEWLQLCLLHSRLLFRSLLPWPHHRIVPRTPLRYRLSELLHPLRFFKTISKEHTSAGQLAAAVWVGIFIGALPIIPFGIATIIYVNHKLHLNKLAGVGASNICIAPFVPLLCIELGHFFRYGRFWYDFNQQTLLFEIHHRLWEWLLGALVIGPLIGLAGALLTYWLVSAIREKSKSEQTIEDSLP